MLAALGSDLYSPVSIPAGWFGSADARQWTGRIRDLIADEYATSTLFVLKDPRIALFLPLWSEALRTGGDRAAVRAAVPAPRRRRDLARSARAQARQRQRAAAGTRRCRVAALCAGGGAVHARPRAHVRRVRRGAGRLAHGIRTHGTAARHRLAEWAAADAEIDAFLDAGRGRDAGSRVADDVAEPCRSVYACLEQAVPRAGCGIPGIRRAAAQAVAIAEDLLGSHIVARERVFDDLRSRADAAAQSARHRTRGGAIAGSP